MRSKSGVATVTLRDIAREAGVSITSASHALNNTRPVSPDVRERVMAAAVRMNYRPNGVARSLRSGQTKVVGLMIPDNSNPFFAEIARAIEDIGFEHGRSVILCNTDGNQEKESAYVDVLIRTKVDGVVYIASGGDEQEHLAELSRAGIPLVVADREFGRADVDIVLVDHEKGAMVATDYLATLGHRVIGCISGPANINSSQERVNGYKKALLSHGLSFSEQLLVESDFRFSGGEEAMRLLLATRPMPTAVFCCNDMMAIGALRAARKAGVSVPRDLSIMGFDGIPLASTVDPPLTTITQPSGEIARTAMECLLSRIERRASGGPAAAARHVLTGQLTIRESCLPLTSQATPAAVSSRPDALEIPVPNG
jgi:LacI family transcriptional regulator